ncbi:hypothetical protein [Isoptericola sp. QY 916]|uniref:hypothetical protein n=1 Tax=Isoptericola sp. QY 916 TaxID=2782570 RepID=UPI003D2FCA7B|nr:hypothetical protein [Isoptericola sp. QY 916]
MSMDTTECVDVAVEDWIDGVSYVQTKVTIYRDPAMYAEYEPLLEKIDEADALVAELEAEHAPEKSDDSALGEDGAASTFGAESSLGETEQVPKALADARARRDELIAEAEALYARYEANREVWHIRALDQDEIRELADDVGIPETPDPLRSGATAAQQKAYTRRVEKHIEDLRKAKEEVDLRGLARAVQSVEVAGETKAAPSLDGLRRVKSRPGGRRHIRDLTSALERITLQEVQIAAPHRAGA